MNQKITRRRLAAAAFLPAATLRAAQTAAGPPENLNTAAKEQIRKNSEALGKTPLPMSTEPAFSFKA